MRHFILILFVLLPFCLFSQVNENFDGTELSADWFGKDVRHRAGDSLFHRYAMGV